MWKGGEKVPPIFGTPHSLFWEASEPKNGLKRTCFLKKTLRRNSVNISVFVFLRLVAMKSVIFEFVGIYDVLCMHVFFQNAVNTGVFLRRWSKNIEKYSISDMLCCESVAKSGVLLRFLFGVLQKHCNYQCFGSIFWLRG